MGGCSGILGAGLTKSASNTDCGVAGGRAWMTDSQPDLSATFTCLATVGTDGSGNEQTMGSAVFAVGDILNAPGACNDGFIRDDALLVITVISDEEDGGSPGTAAEWRTRIVEAKGGDEAAIVPLGLIGDNDTPDGICVGEEAAASPKLREFFMSFTHGSTGSVCADDFTPFFLDAVSIISTACDEYRPAG